MNKSNMPVSDKNSPVKYCFFMTGNEPWLELARELHNTGVATPVLWLGDDRHYEGAKSTFGDSVVRMLDFVHRPVDIPKINYLGEYSEFFATKDYLDAKDICLKMMDRLDLNGTFSRIDREVYFHKLLIWALKFFYEKKPDAVLMIEKPHSHAQYLIFRVARYLGLPTAHFKDCALMPVNFLQKEDGSFVKRAQNIDPSLLARFESTVNEYVDTLKELSCSKSSFSPHYMVRQRNDARLGNRIKKIFSVETLYVLRYAASDIKLLLDKKYRATNPYRFFFVSRYLVKRSRQRNLYNAIASSIHEVNFNNDYYYFPLHYEPERTTNPDGEAYHDQFKVLVLLRRFLPSNIDIVVKEHPSQFLMADRGSRGRSPLFYQLVNNIGGITLAGPEVDSFDLMRNSEGVATITGSVALEASLLGKPAIVFGQAWYAGCPNVVSWSEVESYDTFSKCAVASVDDVRNFLVRLISNYGVPMINNCGQLNMYKECWYDDSFVSSQHDGMRGLIESFIDSEVKKRVN
ncbi:hypothetical protein M9194_08900 [Vibrio sp. S4M6]|uniref:capsular polysaccharide export protein, LipB/KpsS family n=1 Tax=Vibrio sinus TaxID=2946865 RepID=UPI00202A6519|nr:hypothetical protein [Vibrio sinus]MCL9781544.1 hypothetical protein [Vibrio sinus]